ncbi:MAG: hypothetical protein QOH24_660 [Verrucomicrobiota bacterium]
METLVGAVHRTARAIGVDRPYLKSKMDAARVAQKLQTAKRGAKQNSRRLDQKLSPLHHLLAIEPDVKIAADAIDVGF